MGAGHDLERCADARSPQEDARHTASARSFQSKRTLVDLWAQGCSSKRGISVDARPESGRSSRAQRTLAQRVDARPRHPAKTLVQRAIGRSPSETPVTQLLDPSFYKPEKLVVTLASVPNRSSNKTGKTGYRLPRDSCPRQSYNI
ncbi:hypothetical protein LR48_Vigan05g037500 [Vigna angularis]|uniref:Uncharacterized protein n=1 Tax=Phaseolus angularis TaxID=3914 RepID=A0A0L9UJ94_PHAAN|nr:hypothetical protein LR48_Vigan05g037500 [Vigna angularis]